jgi:hypothetical protein
MKLAIQSIYTQAIVWQLIVFVSYGYIYVSAKLMNLASK